MKELQDELEKRKDPGTEMQEMAQQRMMKGRVLQGKHGMMGAPGSMPGMDPAKFEALKARLAGKGPKGGGAPAMPPPPKGIEMVHLSMMPRLPKPKTIATK